MHIFEYSKTRLVHDGLSHSTPHISNDSMSQAFSIVNGGAYMVQIKGFPMTLRNGKAPYVLSIEEETANFAKKIWQSGWHELDFDALTEKLIQYLSQVRKTHDCKHGDGTMTANYYLIQMMSGIEDEDITDTEVRTKEEAPEFVPA